MYTLVETLLVSNKGYINTMCVVFYSLNFLKPLHIQNVHLLTQYTPDNDIEQRDILSGQLLMEYH